jgi:hypothetical protein
MALSRQFASWLKDQVPKFSKCGFLCLSKSEILLKNGKKVCCSFTRASYCMSENVISFQNDRDDFPLDHGGVLVVKVLAGLDERLGNEDLVE